MGTEIMALGMDDNSQKITQAYCHYRQGSPEANCANCHHYTGNSCEIVQDPIEPNGLCDFHAPGQQQPMLGPQAMGPQAGGAY